MTPDEESDKVRQIIITDRQETANLKTDVTKDITLYMIKNIDHRRELLKHITLISAAILGLAPLLLDKTSNQLFLSIGALGHLLIIIFVFSYLRSLLDKESKDLLNQQNKYRKVLQEKLDLADTYIGTPLLTSQSLLEYEAKLKSQPLAIALKTEQEIAQKKEKDKPVLDYFNDLIIVLFIESSLILFLSVFINKFR